MSSRGLAGVVSTVLLVGLTAACGNNSSNTAAGTGKCDNSSPVKVGLLIGLTGANADNGKLHVQGAKMAADEINNGGGVSGKCLDLVIKDDAGTPATGAQSAQELVFQEKVAVMEGTQLTTVTNAALQVTTPAKMILLTASTDAAAGDAKANPYAFMGEGTAAAFVEGQVDFLKSQGLTHPGVISTNDAFGTASLDAIKDIPGATVAGSPQMFQTGTSDLTTQMRALVKAGADSILMFAVGGPDQTAVLKARNLVAPKLPIIGNGATPNKDIIGNFTPAQLKGVYAGPFYKAATYSSAGKPESAKMSDFIAKYKKFIGNQSKLTDNISQMAHGYDNIYTLADAIEGAKSTDSDKIKSWLETHPVEGVLTTYKWSADSHQGVTPESGDWTAIVADAPVKDGLFQDAAAK